MTRDQTRNIREDALEDDSLTANARLMLSLIIDWHHKEKGCVMHDSTLGDKLGMSTRTARRRRHELIQAGYLTEKHGAHRRELVPTHPDSSDHTPDTSVQNGDIGDDTPDRSDNPPPDTSDQHREINNPEGTREGAPAQGNDSQDAVTDEDDLFLDLVLAWRGVNGAPPMTEGIEEALHRWAKGGDVTNPDLFSDVLRDAVDSTSGRDVGVDLAILRQSYEEAEKEAKSKYMPSSDPDLDV